MKHVLPVTFNAGFQSREFRRFGTWLHRYLVWQFEEEGVFVTLGNGDRVHIDNATFAQICSRFCSFHDPSNDAD